MRVGASEEVHEGMKEEGVRLGGDFAFYWKVENSNQGIRHKHAEISSGSWCRCRRMTFSTGVSGSGVRDSPETALLTPIKGLALHFLGISSSGRRWNCAPRFVFVGAILAVPRREG
jgi:hypothetical protein